MDSYSAEVVQYVLYVSQNDTNDHSIDGDHDYLQMEKTWNKSEPSQKWPSSQY